MSARKALVLQNPAAVPFSSLPVLPLETFRTHLREELEAGAMLSALFGVPEAIAAPLLLLAILSRSRTKELALLGTRVESGYRSLTLDIPQAQGFEREIAEQLGVIPAGHPWLKPLLLQAPAGMTDFFRVEGEEVHEVAVGPVHAGVIEPGHFRFQCHGENVFFLEIALGYQHRGLEQALAGGPDPRTPHLMETLAGDTTIGHATASSQLMEALAECEAPERAQAIRAAALELERMANHVGDLGALAGDVGYLPTSSYCGRIRGDLLNLSALICGSRFGRGLVRPGGTAFDLDDGRLQELRKGARTAFESARNACDLLWRSPAVLARFEGTVVLTREMAGRIGVKGPAARASGIARDVRRDLPCGWFLRAEVELACLAGGDVYSRAMVRWMEIEASAAFLDRLLEDLPQGKVRLPLPPLGRERIAVSLTEGWRGEICHAALTDERGRLRRYKVVDPSFNNWLGLACAMRGQEISDFPLGNKSFNLSYCGHDL